MRSRGSSYGGKDVKIFRNRRLPRRGQRRPHGGARIQDRPLHRLVLRPGAQGQDSHRQGHPPLELYVRVRALRGPHVLGRGRLSAARHHDAQRVLHRARGRLRLRRNDKREPQPLPRQRHQAAERPGREDGGERPRRDRGVPRRRSSRAAARHRRGHRPHGGLLRGPQQVHRLPHQPLDPLVQGREGRPRLRQRQHLDDSQERVRRPGRGYLRHRQQARRPEHQRGLRLHAHRRAARAGARKRARRRLRLRRRRGPLPRRGRKRQATSPATR